MAKGDESKNAITVFGALGSPQGGDAEPLTIDLTAIETRMDEPKAEAGAAAAGAGAFRWDHHSPLAAGLLIAVLVGAVAGAAATAGLSGEPAAPAAAVAVASPADETRALQETVTRLTGELAALKASADAASRTASQQLAKIGERLDRAEKAQAEPAAKLARISESLDRMERRVAAADVTGSVTVEKQQSKPAEIEGWKLRDYYAGRAVIESRNGTLFEVSPGATLPGIGKIETIKRVDGKVVVTTPKGIIASALDAPPQRRQQYFLPPGYY